ncbi:hypothetical protein EK21DRAFT_92713 [Setomelanomma holmii]|uniref:Uncharacterized protein n=1 Tax=Setomelanomma holmii TaxID=210430 RepID=A0A9P4LIZ6_9PLEO|nr:hypothetical protein EK21DRAFT_92713 [Setomelanomma holmii]
MMHDTVLVQLQTRYSTETSLLILALREFTNLRTVDIAPALQGPASAHARRHSLLQHPPTMIMAAVMEGVVSLSHLNFADDRVRSSEVGPMPCSGLGALLIIASNLNKLSLSLDRASLAEHDQIVNSHGYKAFTALAKTPLPGLRHCELKGWDLPDHLLREFLSGQHDILHHLELKDCTVLGDFSNVLRALLESRSLRSLKLHLLGWDFERVIFPHTSEVYELILDWEWVAISPMFCTTSLSPWQDWDESLRVIIADMAVTTTLVSPTADDAVNWFGLPPS